MFTYIIASGPQIIAASGNGPLRATARALIKLAASSDITLKSPSERYLSVRPQLGFARSVQRMAKMKVLGVSALLHILWTGQGPEPLSPFLIFCALDPNPFEWIMREFILFFDDDDRVTTLLEQIEEVEDRRRTGRFPLLKPVERGLNAYCEQQVSTPLFLHSTAYLIL